MSFYFIFNFSILLITFVNKPESSGDLAISIIVVLDPKRVAFSRKDTKTLLPKGASTFFVNGQAIFIKGPRDLGNSLFLPVIFLAAFLNKTHLLSEKLIWGHRQLCFVPINTQLAARGRWLK